MDRLLGFLDRRRRILFALVGLMLLLSFNGRWRLGPDSTLYVSLARALASGRGYHSLGWPRANAHFGLPLMLAANFRVFGTETLWPPLVAMLLVGLSSVVVTYRLLLMRLSRAHAVAVTLMVACCFTFNAYGVELLTDLPGYFGIVSALWAFEALVYGALLSWGKRVQWWLLLLGSLWMGAAMRPVVWSLVLAMAALLAWRAFRKPAVRRPAIVVLLVLAAGIALFYRFDPRASHGGEAHEAWLHHMFIEQPRQTLDTIVHRTLPLIVGPTTVEACFAISPGRVLSVPLALVLWIAALLAVRWHPLWRLWIVGNVFMLLVYPEPQTRYLLPVLPFLALGFFQICAVVGGVSARPVAAAALAACLACWFVPNLARYGGLVYRQHSTPFVPTIDYGRYVSFEAMADHLADALPSDALIVSDDALFLEAFHPALHLMMPIGEVPPPDLAVDGPAALAGHRLYLVESDPAHTERLMRRQQLVAGPPLFVVHRPAWELPRFPQRWFTSESLPDLPPLVLRQLLPPPPSTLP